jgi:hypothetical protein
VPCFEINTRSVSGQFMDNSNPILSYILDVLDLFLTRCIDYLNTFLIKSLKHLESSFGPISILSLGIWDLAPFQSSSVLNLISAWFSNTLDLISKGLSFGSFMILECSRPDIDLISSHFACNLTWVLLKHSKPGTILILCDY